MIGQYLSGHLEAWIIIIIQVAHILFKFEKRFAAARAHVPSKSQESNDAYELQIGLRTLVIGHKYSAMIILTNTNSAHAGETQIGAKEANKDHQRICSDEMY